MEVFFISLIENEKFLMEEYNFSFNFFSLNESSIVVCKKGNAKECP